MQRGGDNAARFLSQDTHILRGVRRVVSVAQPATQTDWSVTVPGGVLWRLLGGVFTLTTDANVVNRITGFMQTVQGTPVWLSFFSTALAASTTRRYVLDQGGTLVTTNLIGTNGLIGYVPIWLASGDLLGSFSTNLQAGDQYSAISLLIEEAQFSNQELSEWEEQYEAARTA